jgi:trehalose synthase
MSDLLSVYEEVAGKEVVEHLRQLARPIVGSKVVHVNSTRFGGGVAEILHKLIPLKQALGIDAQWEVITGDAAFYECTKSFHNALQGERLDIPQHLLAHYEATNERNADELRGLLEEADFVFIHDPQPAPLLALCPDRRGKWVWRCHIDLSRPYRKVWRYLRRWVVPYDASVFSLPEFSQELPHPQYLIPPSIDPLSEKNMDLSETEVARTLADFGIDPEIPLVVQVSRFDRFKDPLGVIQAHRLISKITPVQLVLAGGEATDDPEGAAVLREVHEAAGDDQSIHVLLLPPDAHRTINALQRGADIVMQKSLREGFGLTVAEAMWKSRPVIGGDTGGIRLQVVDHYTGFLVNTPEGAALRTRYLLHRRDELTAMGERAKRHIWENFLLTRHLRDYLSLMIGLQRQDTDRVEVWQ